LTVAAGTRSEGLTSHRELLVGLSVEMTATTTTPPRWNVAAAMGWQEKWWVLFATVVVFTCEWIDRSLITVSMEPIKQELGFSDTELGGVAAASYWVSAVAVLPIGRLADRWCRRDVIAVSLCIWAGGTVISGFCSTFFTLCLARGLVGLGTAGFYPVAESMIADFFPAEQRGTAYGWFGFAWTFGYLLGMVCGGWMVALVGWRTTFVTMGTPQCIVALLFHLTVPTADVQTSHRASNTWTDVLALSKLRTLQAVWAGIFFATVSGAMGKFLPSFYVRVHGMGIGEVGTFLGVYMLYHFASRRSACCPSYILLPVGDLL
jgi:MFS family permease